MAIIKVEHLTFSYSSSTEPIFDDVSFQIDTDWKLGFTGRNGRGKTTFLQLLLGTYEYQGKITSSVSFDYFPYSVEDKSRQTIDILHTLCPAAEIWELIRELSYLAITESVLERPFDTLSHGEQTKILLAALFLRENHFLLIDEPTNHLDTEARMMVSAYLKKKKGFILVSHDRCFLDGCVDHILSIQRSDIEIQTGSFSSWMSNFHRRQQFEMRQEEQLRKDIRRLQKASRKTGDWSHQTEASKYGNGPVDRGYIGHKSAKLMKRSKAIQARQENALQQKAKLLKNIEVSENLKILPLSYQGNTLVEFSDVQIYRNHHAVCAPVSFSIRSKERLALEGKNGSGKSSLLKLLLGESIPHSGIITIGSQLTISYVAQDTAFLKGSLCQLAQKSHIEEQLFKAILRKMDFSRTQLEKKMEYFSEGQKKKVLLAKSLCEQAHLYIWDEPLNFIDLNTRIQLEQLILTYSPTMIFVEHDRAFKEAIATTSICL